MGFMDFHDILGFCLHNPNILNRSDRKDHINSFLLPSVYYFILLLSPYCIKPPLCLMPNAPPSFS